MNILVTGGAGFIGSHLCEKLLSEGHKVICLDNLCTGRPENILHMNDPEAKLQIIIADVKDKINIFTDIDQIYHLASRASPKDFKKHSIDIMQTNSLGTENMLRLAMGKNARILLASTSEAYGEPTTHPQNEEYRGNVSTTGMRGCYDESKRYAEALVTAYRRRFGVDVRIARIFNTYGPKMRADDGRAVPAFIDQSMHNKPMTVFGDGTQTRSFCYVDDMVNGLMALMNTEHPDLCYPTNIGNDKEDTILDLAKLIKELTQSNSEIIFEELPQDDPTRRCPDISKAKELLHWEPKIKLKNGLREIIARLN